MAESVNAPSRGPKSPAITSFDLQVEQFSVFALKKAVTCSRVDPGQQIDHFATTLKNHWHRNSSPSRWIGMNPSEFELGH
jgi:hypothetical protein